METQKKKNSALFMIKTQIMHICYCVLAKKLKQNKTQIIGYPMDSYYRFSQSTDRPTESQFLNGIGQAVKRTGLVKSLFRPSDDATVYPFFIPGNAFMSVGLARVAQLVQQNNAANNQRLTNMAKEMDNLSKEIRDAIYKYAITEVPDYGKVFACKVSFLYVFLQWRQGDIG